MLFDDPMIAGNTSFAAPGVLGSNTMAPSIQVDPPTAADDKTDTMSESKYGDRSAQL